jgi:hypothetical protein
MKYRKQDIEWSNNSTRNMSYPTASCPRIRGYARWASFFRTTTTSVTLLWSAQELKLHQSRLRLKLFSVMLPRLSKRLDQCGRLKCRGFWFGPPSSSGVQLGLFPWEKVVSDPEQRQLDHHKNQWKIRINKASFNQGSINI